MTNQLVKTKSQIQDSHTYKDSFEYKHSNPYHDKLKEFSNFVLRDLEGESLKGKWNHHFQTSHDFLNVEVGTGYGQFMIDYTQDHPDQNFVGIDYRFKRSYQLAKKLARLKHQNFKYLRAKGERLSFLFSESEVDQVFYFFPDPWPKLRHHKKRLFQRPFLEGCQKILKQNGKLLIKTDHDGYFDWMLETVEANKDLGFKNLATSFDLHKDTNQHLKVLQKYKTKFEKIFLKKDIKIKAMVLSAS